MAKKILFIRQGSFSHINESVKVQLGINFPEYHIEDCDVQELMATELRSVKNWFFLFYEYGWHILRRKKYYGSWFICTSYIFKAISKKIRDKYKDDGDVVFTFQTQSLFDASLPGIPHYLYTDSTVLSNYEYNDLEPTKFLKSKSWMKLERSAYQSANLNFVFSTNQFDSIVDQYDINAEKVKCVFAGPNSPMKTIPQYSSNETKNILFIGVDWDRKGGVQLWNACKKIKEDFVLTVVGCEPRIESDKINVLGRIPLGDVDVEFSKADILCVPTLQEPFGIVFIEAMMRKIPVISTRLGALPDMVKQDVNGILVEPYDETGLQKAIEKLLNDENLCRSMGEEGAKIAAENYTWEKTGVRISNHIRQSIK